MVTRKEYMYTPEVSNSTPLTIFCNDSKVIDDFGKVTLFNYFVYSVFTTNDITLPSGTDTLHSSVERHLYLCIHSFNHNF